MGTAHHYVNIMLKEKSINPQTVMCNLGVRENAVQGRIKTSKLPGKFCATT
jgi:hypothetical protein